jgi:phenylacetate-CoA ligase
LPAPPGCSRTSPRSASARSASSWRARRRRRSNTSGDAERYREQLAYLLERSPFYREKLGLDVSRELADIADLPLTEKSELRRTVTPQNPFGAHLCVEPAELVRIYSTSGTTGTPSYIPLTAGDLDNWITGSARSYAASGIAPGEKIVSTYNAGPFVAGAALAAFDRIGLTHIPVGTGNTERLIRAVELLRPENVVLTPSYAAHLAERRDLRNSSVRRVLVAGEPGGGEPAFRAKLEEGWGAKVTEAMGIGDIGVSLWGECEEQDGMHLGAYGFVHPELIDPASGRAIPMEDGANGELVLTHLQHRAAPLLRFRTRDHVMVKTSPCACGRTGPRIRCVGRTDDMLIVRGINVFPSAIREVVSGFAPDVSGQVRVRPGAPGVKQEPPLPVTVELARDRRSDEGLAEAIRARVREVLVVQTSIELVPWGSLERSEYKSTLVER